MVFVVISALILLYLWFRVAMWYLRNKHRIREEIGWSLVLLEAALAPGLVLDVIVNWTIGMTLGFVKCWTLSEKLCYIRTHPEHGKLWQHDVADWICEDILNKWDPNRKHC